ncbi:MAG: hypothetical protein K8I27_00180 [Planctomycetes bacterium]|nr:hypothetical protein [Planctomycetota bacterium]
MRLLFVMILCAPCLFALDTKDIDGDTLRSVRIALLKDEVRGHFGLRIGDFESLDQALRVKFDGAHLLCMRLGGNAACVIIRDSKPGAHLFMEIENSVRLAAFDDCHVILRCNLADDGPERARLLRLHDGKLELCFTWTSSECEKLEGGRYTITTVRELRQEKTGLRLTEATSYALDGKQVEGGHAECAWDLLQCDAGLKRGDKTETRISVTTNCTIARRLERDNLTEAAYHHARLAEARAKAENFREDDSRRLDAMSLVTRLQARLREPGVVAR